MADTATLVKKAFGIGEEFFEVQIFSSTTGKVVQQSKPVAVVRIYKNSYDALSAGKKTATNAITIANCIDAAYDISEI